jgi:hypothetical protein
MVDTEPEGVTVDPSMVMVDTEPEVVTVDPSMVMVDTEPEVVTIENVPGSGILLFLSFSKFQQEEK